MLPKICSCCGYQHTTTEFLQYHDVWEFDDTTLYLYHCLKCKTTLSFKTKLADKNEIDSEIKELKRLIRFKNMIKRCFCEKEQKIHLEITQNLIDRIQAKLAKSDINK